MPYDTTTKMFLYNYYIQNGSFSNLSKNAPSLYRKLLNDKKENAEDSVTLTQYLEYKLLPHRKNTSIDSAYIRYLYEHYEKSSKLVGEEIPKGFENKLQETANQLNVDVEKVKEMFDNNAIYPELISQIKNKVDMRAYNNLLTIISLNMFIESKTKPHIKMNLFHDFDDFSHLRKYEPSYATLLKSKIPKYAGPLTGNENVKIKVEGTKYYGVDLQLGTIPTLLDDIMCTFKGYVASANLTPSLTYKIQKMYEVCGNLNRIGLDKFNMIEELDKLSMNLGFKSIKELLEKEGYRFTPLESKRVNFIPCREDFEVIIDGYDKAQILIDEQLIKYLKDMNLDQTLNVEEITPPNQDGQNKVTISLLAYEYEGVMKPVHTLLTKQTKLNFKDNNTLNLTAINIA